MLGTLGLAGFLLLLAGTIDALLCCKQGTENVMRMLLEAHRWEQQAAPAAVSYHSLLGAAAVLL
jgi:hypothetical protein